MNALTVVFAALCIFAIGYRFYGLFIANKVLNLNDARVTPGRQVLRRPRLCGYQQVRALRAPFRRHSRRRPPARTRAGRPVRLHARPALDSHRLRARGRRARYGRAVRLGAAPGAEPRLHRLTGNRQDDRLRSGVGRACHPPADAGGPVHRRGQRHGTTACGPPTPWPRPSRSPSSWACTCDLAQGARCSGASITAWSCLPCAS